MPKSVYLFISPHLDDVALSCGGYIGRLTAAGERVVIATVATADAPSGTPLSWLMKRNHRAWRLGDTPFGARRCEDIAAADVLGAQYAHLGLLDASYRRKADGKPLYTKNTVGVPVHPDDWKCNEPIVRQKLQELLRFYAGDNVQVFCPLGVGEHVDHIFVRHSVETLCAPQNITYYEDYPYAGQSNAVHTRLNSGAAGHWQSKPIALTPTEVQARIAAIGCFESQVPGLFPSLFERVQEIARARLPGISSHLELPPSPRASRERMDASLTAYIARVGGERYWRLETRVQASPAVDTPIRKEEPVNEAMTDHAPLQLTRLSSIAQFNALEAEWNTLAETRVETIFLTHDWLRLWWQFYGADYDLWTLIARDGRTHGELVGIVPLMLHRDSNGFGRLMFMGAGDITPNHLDIIARPDKRMDVLRGLSAYLCQTSAQWDIFELDKLPADACTAEQLNALLHAQGLVTRIETTARCPYVELPASFETFLQACGPSTRKNFGKNRRRFERDFSDVRIARVETVEELNMVMDALIRMHQVRWTQKGYPGSFSNDHFVGFHRAMALRALQAGCLRLYFIRIGLEIAAVRYCYRIADSIQFYQTAFDNRWSEYSPGFLIGCYAIEQSILEGARKIDFLEGNEQHKEHWAKNIQDNLRLRVYAPHWRGKLANVHTQATTKALDWGTGYLPLRIRRPIWQAVLKVRTASRQARRKER
jgi:CelD/BcsL family acetyltransferase involved in cellulose biosynthesis/LmbE family N-acetylglucosaminyl deacetylase